LLVELLGDTLSMFESQAKTKGVALSLTLDAAAPAAVLIDPLRARQILINLIGNALKFTDKGDVSVTAAYDRRGARLKVRVADTGAGMTRAQQTKLFQRFSQVDASSTRRHSGTGLGLAICRGLVDAMGGDIGVKSRVGQGSVFHFSIAAPVAEAPPARQGDVQPAAVALEDIRVLVVDDNRANRDLARAILGHLGAEVSEAIDGPTALTAAAQFPVDVILMDIRMPGMDGPELLARIRATPGPNRDVPILAFTADADTDHLEGGFGFNGVVRKPLSPPELVASILRATAWHPEEVSDVAA
jgi:CheY-like chemotaxis protein